ncbi:MAG: hypothetical protein J6J39_00015 [Clostridia bacterium]|nr:hypothetical protein [Clostridia bacterium]
MKEYRLPKKTVVLWQLRLTVLCAVLLALVSLTLFLSKWMLILLSTLFLVFILFIAVFVPLHIKSYKIEVSRETVVINRGVIIRVNHILPFPRFIYAEKITSPIAAAMGVSALSLKVARGFILIPEMNKEDAEDIIWAISGEKNEI